MNIKILFFLYITLILLSCSGKKDANRLILLKHIPIEVDNLLIGEGIKIGYINSHLIVLDNKSDIFFHLINLKDKTYLGEFGKRGQGPDEFIMPFTLHPYNESSLCCFDIQMQLLFELKVDSAEILFSPIMKMKDILNFAPLPISDSCYISMGVYPDGVFRFFDKKGTHLKTFFSYPSKDGDEIQIPETVKAFAYQGKIAISNSKLVHATGHCKMINFYEIKGEEIIPTFQQWDSYPDYKPESGEATSAIMHAASPECFMDLIATNDFVYLLYSGRSFKEYGLSCFESEHIYMYNWDGELIKIFKLDIPVVCFCLDEKEEKIYAVANNPDPVLVEFDLK